LPTPTRFRFATFTLSPRQRTIWRDGEPVALTPKYFDLLLFLVRRRGDAVSKQAIFTEVWPDVIVSDGALAQAVRVLRRTLDDDAKEPRFIRTVARHGYQFVWVDVSEEADEGTAGTHQRADVAGPVEPPLSTSPPEPTSLDALVDQLLALSTRGLPARDEARDLAERLHLAGTAEALTYLTARPNHGFALAVLRDARWNVAGAGPVPLLRSAQGAAAVLALVRLRLADMGRTVANRWVVAAGAGAAGGALAGVAGGVALLFAPESTAQPRVLVALAGVGAAAGGVGAAGVGAGLAAAEVLARSHRPLALAACGGLAGALAGSVAVTLLDALLSTLVGVRLELTGGLIEGLLIGSTAGAAYAAATPQPSGGGVAAPVGRRRLTAALTVGLACAVAAALLSRFGHPLVGGHVHLIAQAVSAGESLLGPLGRLVGEPGFGPVAQSVLGAFEGAVFGLSLAYGLTHRPRS
jgi:DNA-binding winged helix-turn-helix (wHTH) protein